MKLARFSLAGGDPRFGVLDGEWIDCLSGDPLDGGEMTGERVVRADVRLLAPCSPGKVIGVAINYPGATGRDEEMSEPLVFLKSPGSVIGPDEAIVCPFPELEVWGESELALVIGKRLACGDRDAARSAVFGYTVANDVSAENVYGWDHHLARSKAIDTFCPLGPHIDTEFDPAGKRVQGFHNGELLRDGDADQRVWREPELVAWLSSWMILEPWDVILTGAPTRVRDRRYLATGDRFTCRVEGLGELSNPFRFRGACK